MEYQSTSSSRTPATTSSSRTPATARKYNHSHNAMPEKIEYNYTGKFPVYPNFPEKKLPKYGNLNYSEEEDEEVDPLWNDEEFKEMKSNKKKNINWQELVKNINDARPASDTNGSGFAKDNKRILPTRKGKRKVSYVSEEEEEYENESSENEEEDENDETFRMYNYTDGRQSKKPYEKASNNAKHAFEVSNELLGHFAGRKPIETFPLMETNFNSWQEFEYFKELYEKKHFVKFALKTSNSISWINERLNAQNKKTFPEQYEYYRKGYICTHGWGKKYRGKSNKISSSRNTDCEAMMNVQLIRIGGDIVVKVRKQYSTHNHLCNEELFSAYHDQRRLLDQKTLGVVEKMVAYKMERTQIWQYIRSQGKDL